jgi:DNA (cytosine-5)-methyltransferase 1
MKTLHLFAGAGGGLLADLILGHEPIGAVEWDSYCCQVLRERRDDGWFPGLDVHECDIRAFDASIYAGRVDCVSGGFPCQDVSIAGSGQGLDGKRSGLWSEFARVLREVRPRFAFIENSPALVFRGLDRVLSDLAAMGFDAEWAVISAADVGAPHLRERVWIMADGESVRRRAGGARRFDTSGSRESKQTLSNVADSNSVMHRHGYDGACSPVRSTPEGDEGRRKGVPDAEPWHSEPDVGRVATGVAFAVDRIRALGNGQVPLQAALAWRVLTAR